MKKGSRGPRLPGASGAGKWLLSLFDDQRARFLFVGGVNTVVGYGLFVAIYIFSGKQIGYLGSLYCSYAAASIMAFLLHRNITYRMSGSGSIVVDFLRFASVHLIALLANTLMLPALVELARVPVPLAQAAITIFTTVVSYFGHKFFSFHRAPPAPQESDRD